MNSVTRITVSLPSDLAADLSYVHRRVGVSRSAFVAAFLEEGIRDLRALLESLPDSPTPDDVVRLRGDSVDLVNSRMQQFKQLMEGQG
jgi:hypothetical protein